MRIALLLPSALLALLGACGDDATGPEAEVCVTVDLPVPGFLEAPTITDVALEIQPHGVVVLATATHPGGDDLLRDVQQSVGVYPDAACAGEPWRVVDDLAGSGVEESFGTAVEAAENPDLYQAIAASDGWPVEVDFQDRAGRRTTARVLARVVR